MFTLILTGLLILPTCSCIHKSFHRVSGIVHAMLPFNESTRTQTLTSCALQCVQYKIECESFIYDPVKFHCTFGGRQLTLRITLSPGQIMYSTGKTFCDPQFGYFLTSLGESELCARVVWTAVTYAVASSDCTGHHGRLLTINTAERNALVLKLLQSFNNATLRAWVGLNDLQVEGEFVWSDGAHVTANQTWLFRAGQPDNAYTFGEDCCEYIYAKSGNGLNDANCASSFGFICEYIH